MAFSPGVSGNPSGKRKERLFREALTIVLNEKIEGAGEDRRRIRKIAEALVSKAEDGDVAAAREVMDRVDGKVAQQTILNGDDDGGPVNHAVSVSFVAPKVE